MTKEEAIAAVERGEAQRICVPGQWVVWRDGDRTCLEVKA